jgi:hypothetical protein
MNPQEILDSVGAGERISPAPTQQKAPPAVSVVPKPAPPPANKTTTKVDPWQLLNEIAGPAPAEVEAPKGKKQYPPPTSFQQIMSPIGHGVGSLYDLFSAVPGLVLKLPQWTRNAARFMSDGQDVIFGRPVPRREPDFIDSVGGWGDKLLAQVGPEHNPLMGLMREYGVMPENPEWRPEGWAARGLHNTSELGSQILLGGWLSRAFTPAVPAVKSLSPVTNRAVATTLPEIEAMGPYRTYVVPPAVGGFAGSTAYNIAPKEYRDTAEAGAMGVGSLLPLMRMPARVAEMFSKVNPFDLFKSETYAETGTRLAALLGRHPRHLLDKYTEAEKSAPKIPGYAPSPGAIMDDVPLLGIERQQANKATPIQDPLNPGSRLTPAELRLRNDTALDDSMRHPVDMPDGAAAKTAVEGVQGTIAQQRAASERVSQGLMAQADLLEENARKAQQVVSADMPPTPVGGRTQAKSDASSNLYRRFDAREDVNKVHAGELFDAADPALDAKVELYSIRDALDAVYEAAFRRGRLDRLPNIMRPPKDVVLDKIDDYLHNWQTAERNPQFLANVPYERIKGLRERITDELRETQHPTTREYLSTLLKGVDDAVERSTLPGLAERYAKARTYFRENIAEPFRNSALGPVLQSGDMTGAGPAVFVPGIKGGDVISPMVPQIRADPELYSAFVQYIRADMASSVLDVNGKVIGSRLKEWNDKYGPALKPFPELQKEFERIASAQRSADDFLRIAKEKSPGLRALAKEGIINTEDAIMSSAARFYLNAEPSDVIRRLVGLKGSERAKMAGETMGLIQSKEGREGMARAYYDDIVRRVLGGADRARSKPAGNSFAKILDEESDLAEVLLPPGVRDRLRQLDKAYTMESARDRARAGVGSHTPEDVTTPDVRDLSVGHRLIQSLRSDLPSVAGGALVGATLGSSVPGGGTFTGAVVGATATGITKRLMELRTAAKEAALREMIFNRDLFERGMSSASLDAASRRLLSNKIKPYIILANSEAVSQAGEDARR